VAPGRGVLLALARYDAAEQYAKTLLDWQAEHGDPKAQLRAQLLLGLILVESHEPGRAVAVLTPLASETEAADSRETAELVALLARAHLLNGKIREAAELAERALVTAERIELRPVLADALITRGTALFDLGRPHEAKILLRGALDVARQEGLAHTEFRASGNLGYLLWAEDPRTHQEIIRAALDKAGQVGERVWMMFFAAHLNMALSSDGAWSAGIELLEEFESGGLPERDRAGFVAARAAHLAATGDVATAEDLVRSVESIADSETDPQARRGWQLQRARVVLAGGDAQAAYDIAMAAMELDLFGFPDCHRVATSAALVDGSPDRLRAVRDAIDAMPSRVRLLRGARSALTAALAVLDGDEETAAAEFEATRSFWADFPVDRAIFLSAFGRLGAGRHAAAEQAAREGHEVLSGLGADGFLALFAEPAAASP
jgi:tetratricopeptide (TPR) repeat protein